jgi:predicted histone-like DNA-binding protein
MITKEEKAYYDVKRISYPWQEGEKKYHAYLAVKQNLNSDDVANLIAHRCTIKQADMNGAFTALAQIFEEELIKGKSITINGIGTFQIAVNSPGEKSAKFIRSTNVKCTGINFKPDFKLKKYVQEKTCFERVPSAISSCSKDMNSTMVHLKLNEYFKNHHLMTVKDLMLICGLNRSTAYRYIRKEVKAGRMKKVGKRNSGLYCPTPGFYNIDLPT